MECLIPLSFNKFSVYLWSEANNEILFWQLIIPVYTINLTPQVLAASTTFLRWTSLLTAWPGIEDINNNLSTPLNASIKVSGLE